MMAVDKYTVQVCNLSTKTTQKDVKRFFSFCGTVLDVKLERAGKHAQVAFVTFKEPYALETAVLLSGSTIVDEQVCIVPWGGSQEAVIRWKNQSMRLFEDQHKLQGDDLIAFAGRAATAAQDVVTTMASTGYTLTKDALIKAKTLDEKYHVTSNAAAKVAALGKDAWTKARELEEKYQISANAAATAKSALVTAGETMGSAGSAVVRSSYFSAGAMWVAGNLEKAAKAAANLATKDNAVTK